MQTNSTQTPPRIPWGLILVLASVGLLVAGASLRSLWVVERSADPSPPSVGKSPLPQVRMPDAQMQQQVAVFCSDCHRLPAADQFPRSAWEHEVKRGFQFYKDSGRTDLKPPPFADAVAYFESQAPEELEIEPIYNSPNPIPLRFRQAEFRRRNSQPDLLESTISAINWVKRKADGPGELFCSDMRSGRILKVRPSEYHLQATQYATVPHPTNVRVVDLDGDGQSEFVVADLGSYLPEDHELGAVWWIRHPQGETQTPERVPLVTGVGRVADVQPLDADGDGDQDLVVAEFGWHKTGGIHLLENQGLVDGKPKLTPHLLDRRSGTIHVPVADLDGDGRLDFVALISQEHETVVAFLNRGNLKFEPKELTAAQDPSIGSSGLSLVDLDGDKDLDVLLTYGDTFDSYTLKPAHGIYWLQNEGNLKFTRQFIVSMPGAQRALAGDLDGDGDLDIVAAAFIPQKLMHSRAVREFDSVVFLEQTEPGLFERYRLQGAWTHHCALEMADFDEDGDLDLAVGNFAERQRDHLPPLTIWWNQRLSKDSTDSSYELPLRP